MAQVVGFTADQIRDLTTALTAQYNETNKTSKLDRAIASIAPCSGAPTSAVRAWVRSIDTVALDNNDNTFLINLAKHTSREGLREDIGRWKILNWADLKARILSSYLTASEDLIYRQQLKQCVQQVSETVTAYTSRFQSICRLAYHQTRGEVEEQNVIGIYLKGLLDENMSRSVFAKLPVPNTLQNAMDLATSRANDRARYDALIGVKPKNTTKLEALACEAPRTKLNIDVLATRLERLTTKVAKMETNGHNKILKPHKKIVGSSGGKQNIKGFNKETRVCFRCDRPGHLKSQCHAVKH